MDANKKLEMLELEFGLTINHAAEVLEEYVNTLTKKILVDAFNNLKAEDQMSIILELLAETQQDLLDEDSVEAAIEDAFNNIAKNLFLEEKKRREQWQELFGIYIFGK